MARFQEDALQHEMSSERPPQTLANGHRSVSDLQAELHETRQHRQELGTGQKLLSTHSRLVITGESYYYGTVRMRKVICLSMFKNI